MVLLPYLLFLIYWFELKSIPLDQCTTCHFRRCQKACPILVGHASEEQQSGSNFEQQPQPKKEQIKHLVEWEDCNCGCGNILSHLLAVGQMVAGGWVGWGFHKRE